MPYDRLSDLPDAIRRRLPTHAQEIYKSTFNNAWDEYRNSNDREGGSREETSHKVAWSAVKKQYTKTGDKEWRRK